MFASKVCPAFSVRVQQSMWRGTLYASVMIMTMWTNSDQCLFVSFVCCPWRYSSLFVVVCVVKCWCFQTNNARLAFLEWYTQACTCSLSPPTPALSTSYAVPWDIRCNFELSSFDVFTLDFVKAWQSASAQGFSIPLCFCFFCQVCFKMAALPLVHNSIVLSFCFRYTAAQRKSYDKMSVQVLNFTNSSVSVA